MKKCSLKKWGLLLALTLSSTVAFAAVDQGYEDANGVPGTCPTNNTTSTDVFGGTDSQGHALTGFAACNCTSYAAYRLRLNDVKLDNEIFVNNNWGNTTLHFGNATNWNNSAVTAGVREDNYPAIGSVAHWERVTATTADDDITDFGHVAYVQRLWTSATDGHLESIDVMEYNWSTPPDHLYHYRHILIGGRGYPTSFLHFEEKGRDAAITNATCVTGIAPPSGVHAGTFCWVHSGSNAACNSASAYYYYDYRTCQKYAVNNQNCGSVGTNRGYTAHIGDWFPEPIDPAHWGDVWAACDVGGDGGYGGTPRPVSLAPIIKYLLQ